MRRRDVLAGLAGAMVAAPGVLAAPVSRLRLAGPSVPPITVIAIATLTGPDALGPIDAVDGFFLGLKGKARHLGIREVKTAVFDDHGSPDRARALASRLVQHGRTDFVLTAVGPKSLAEMLPVFAKAGSFVISLAPAPAATAGRDCSPWLFDMAGQEDGLHQAAGVRLESDRVRRLAVVAPPGSHHTIHAALSALRATYRGRIETIVTTRRGAMTYDRVLERIAAARVEGIYSLLTGGVGVEFVRAWGGPGGLRFHVPLYAPWTGFDPAYLAAMGESALGIVTLGTWAYGLDNPTNQLLVKRFKTVYGRRVTTWAARGFDAYQLLNAALDVLPPRTVSPHDVRRVLRTTAIQSARGSFAFDNDQFPILDYYARQVVRDERGHFVNRLQGMVSAGWHDPAAGACPMHWQSPS